MTRTGPRPAVSAACSQTRPLMPMFDAAARAPALTGLVPHATRAADSPRDAFSRVVIRRATHRKEAGSAR